MATRFAKLLEMLLVYTPMHVPDKSYPTALSFIFLSSYKIAVFNNKLRVVIFYFIWLSLWNHAISNIDFFFVLVLIVLSLELTNVILRIG